MNLDRWKILLEGAVPDGAEATTVDARYGNGNAIELETGLFLYAFVRRANPTVVVETGTHWGFSSACIAAALADAEEMYPKGRRLYTIDVNSYENKAESLWGRIGVGHLVQRILGDTRQQRIEVPEGRPIDFLWLDADHAADAVVSEWNQFAPRLNRKEAFIGFHDTTLDPREAEGIRQVIDARLYPLNEYREAHHLALRNMRGFDLIQLRGTV